MAPSRQHHRVLPCLLLAALWGAASRAGCSWFSSTFASPVAMRGARKGLSARGASISDMDLAGMEEMMKDPEKMKEMQAQVDKVMGDPEKRKQMEEYSKHVQGAVEKLKADPEMKEFFEDIEKNGFEALKKWEKNEEVLAKFSRATGGPGAMPGMAGMAGGQPAAPAAPALAPGTEVIIDGLQKAPELNGKKAMVVPPTAEEQQKLAGTDRLIVRLLDSGEQFAVRGANLQTVAQAADKALSGDLEDVSMFNPALQTEAAKLRESGKLDDLRNDPELQPIFDDIKKNGMGALQKYWNDDKLMAKINKAMQQQ